MNASPANFRFALPETSVVFGAGARRCIAQEMEHGGFARALIVSGPVQGDLAVEIAGLLGPLAAGIYTGAAMHTPISATLEAIQRLLETRADCIVAIGGGSAIGLAKAVTYRTDIPQIAIPTTYAGSEATPILGQTINGEKATLKDRRVQPRRIIYDPELLVSLPANQSVTSGLNAMAHAVEALYARDRTPLSTLLAEAGLKAFAHALPRVVADPDDLSARTETLYGAWLCGTVLGQVGMALHHKLCHVLGGTFNLPHAETHAVILPHATAFNTGTSRDFLQPVGALFGGKSPADGIWTFARALGAPRSLRDLGLREQDLERAADLSVANAYWNPREVTRDEIRTLLGAAWRGDEPGEF